MMRRRSLIRIDDSNSCRRRVVGGLDRWRLHRTSDGFDENRRRDLERLCDAAAVTRPKTSWRKARPAPAKAERTKPRSSRACAVIRLQRKWSDLACGFQLRTLPDLRRILRCFVAKCANFAANCG